MPRPLLLIAALLAWGLAPLCWSASWQSSDELFQRERFTTMSISERTALAQRLGPFTIGDYLEDADISWQLHQGDLQINGSLDNRHALVVDGDLIIHGDYDDYASGIGMLVVLGELRVDNLMSWGSVYVDSDLKARGLIIAEYNDFTFEVKGKVNARGLVIQDKSSSYERGQLGFVNDDLRDTDVDQSALAVRQLVPELFDPGGFEEDQNYYDLDYRTSVKRMRAGLPLFREQEAPASLPRDLASALDSTATNKAALVGRDPLLDRVLAAHAALEAPLRARLLAEHDLQVRQLMAARAPDSDVVGDPAKVDPDLAEAILSSEALSPALLAQLAASPDMRVRRLVAFQRDLSLPLVEALARDADPEVRGNLLQMIDNALRLPLPLREALARDPNPLVRAAVAATPLPLAPSQALAKDPVTAVRVALAQLLADQALGVLPSELTHEQRSALAETLLVDPQDTVRLTVFPALGPQRQVQAWRDSPLLLPGRALAGLATSGELLGLLLAAAGNDYAQHEWIAENPAVPPEVQLQLVKAASRGNALLSLLAIPEADDEAASESAQTALDALDALLNNPNVSDAALLATALDVRPALETPLYDQHQLPAAALEVLDKRWRDAPMAEDWALTLVLQYHSTRAQLEAALPRWYDSDPELASALDALHALPDQAWWPAMAASPLQELREAVARNAHLSTVQIETLLQDPDEDVVMAAALNPALDETALRRLAARDPELALVNDYPPLALLRELASQGRTWQIRERAREKLVIALKRSR